MGSDISLGFKQSFLVLELFSFEFAHSLPLTFLSRLVFLPPFAHSLPLQLLALKFQPLQQRIITTALRASYRINFRFLACHSNSTIAAIRAGLSIPSSCSAVNPAHIKSFICRTSDAFLMFRRCASLDFSILQTLGQQIQK
jgi:hypothetical protein